jgi:hypothetical protein
MDAQSACRTRRFKVAAGPVPVSHHDVLPHSSVGGLGGRVGASTQRQALLRWALSGSGTVRPCMLADLDLRLARPVRRIGCIGAICVVHFNQRLGAAWASEKAYKQLRLFGQYYWACIEISRPKRRNGAAYLHRHRRSRTGGHAIIGFFLKFIANGRHMG